MIKLLNTLDTIEDFDAWSGGLDTLRDVERAGKMRELDMLIDDVMQDPMTDTELNDFLWFDRDFIFNELGMPQD